MAGGRSWTGRQALERRLVDRLGSLADAVALARDARRAGARRRGRGAPVGRRGARGSSASRPGSVAALAPEPPLARAARSVAGALARSLLLAELGPVLALPEDWLEPARGAA